METGTAMPAMLSFLLVLLLGLPPLSTSPRTRVAVPAPRRADWLVEPVTTAVSMTSWRSDTNPDVAGIELSNGLITRRFTTSPDFATWGYTSHLDHPTGTAILRTVRPEAFVDLAASASAASTRFAVGGVNISRVSSPDEPASTCFFNRSAAEASAARNGSADTFRYQSHRLVPMRKDYNWTAGARGSPPDAQWPPLGLHLVVTFQAPGSAAPLLHGVTVEVHYEMYEGLPAMSKWLTVTTAASAESGASAAAPTRAAAAAARDALPAVEPDQQGRVNLQKCDEPLPKSAGVGASMLWRFQRAARDVGLRRRRRQQGIGTIQLASAKGQPAGGLCLTAVHGTAAHGFNDMLDALPCVTGSDAQLWLWDWNASSPAAGAPIVSALSASQRSKTWTSAQGCPTKNGTDCCVDVNAHTVATGITLQGFDCAGSAGWAQRAANSSSSTSSTLGEYYQIALGSTCPQPWACPAPGACVAFTPALPPPPPPPGPPPPPPPPNPRPAGPVLNNVVVETLATNQVRTRTPSLLFRS